MPLHAQARKERARYQILVLIVIALFWEKIINPRCAIRGISSKRQNPQCCPAALCLRAPDHFPTDNRRFALAPPPDIQRVRLSI